MEPNSKKAVPKLMKWPFGSKKKAAAAKEAKLDKQPVMALPKSRPRRKQRTGHGFSQMDWIRLTQGSQDLGGRGRSALSNEISFDELRQHQSEKDAWMVIRGKVYNVTKYLPFHPGGWDELMRGVGQDATTLFDEFHPWVGIDNMLQKCLVGTLKTEDVPPFHEIVIAEREQLSLSCFRITLVAPEGIGEADEFPCHIQLQLPHPSGKFSIEREYTPALDPHAGNQSQFVLIVRLYSDGFMSKFLCQDGPVGKGQILKARLVSSRLRFVETGSILDAGCTPPVQKSDVEFFNFVVGGTGITPVFQSARLLLANPESKMLINVVHFVRHLDDVPMFNEMQDLKQAHDGKMTITLVVTEPSVQEGNTDNSEKQAPEGSLNAKLSTSMFVDHPDLLRCDRGCIDSTAAVLCGSPDFVREAKKALILAGLSGKQLFHF